MAKKTTGMLAALTFLTGHVANWNKFRLRRSQNLIEVSGFGEDEAEWAGGLRSGTFMVQGTPIFDDTSTSLGLADLSDTPASAVFTIAPGCTETVDCIVADAEVVATHGSDVVATFNGATSGAITEVWDETAGS